MFFGKIPLTFPSERRGILCSMVEKMGVGLLNGCLLPLQIVGVSEMVSSTKKMVIGRQWRRGVREEGKKREPCGGL